MAAQAKGERANMQSIREDLLSAYTLRHRVSRLARQSCNAYFIAAWLCATLFSACNSRLATAADTSASAAGDSGLQEIVVTAEKYNSTIQDTPISMSALSGNDLTAAGITSVEDIAREIPGLSMRSAGPGMTEYEARGIASNGGAAPTVGFYLDEVPLSPPAMGSVGKVVIDPNLYDVNRVEVLRGPQGTLYGSGSEGGTVKIITNQPKLDTFEGSVQGTASYTEGGGGNGGGNIMLNIPAGDVLALRVVASDSYRSGWIDRVVLNPFPADTPLSNPPPYSRGDVLAAPVQSVFRDVNTEYLNGARASLLYQPTSDLSIVATALYQHMGTGGYDEFDSPPGADYLAHYEAFNIPESVSDDIHVYSLTITDNLGFADLTSAAAYWERQERQVQDASESFSLANGIYPVIALPFSAIDTSRQLSQEIRLTSRGDDRLHWVVGGFFSNLNSTFFEYGANEDVFASPDNPSGIAFEGNNPYRMKQFASFVDGSYRITDTLKFSTGVRWYRYLSQQLEQEWGVDAASVTPPVPSKTQASDNGFNPRFNLAYSPNGDLTAYVSATRGFRPGGANQLTPPPNVPPYCPANSPTTFGPDSVWDYEIGEKAKLFDHWLTINSDFYYIKWTGVQETLLLTCGYQYDANAGNGRSFGPELEVNAKLSQEWLVSLSATYTDAEITHPTAALANYVAGSINSCPTANNCTVPILNVPKDAGSLAVVYTTNILENYRLTARLADSYVGASHDESFYFVQLPSYNIANARIGLFADKWSVNLFVDNLTNKVAELSANNTSFQINIPGLIRYATNQPRTFGTQINYRY
jgi:iron complex outermembrane receptor protein